MIETETDIEAVYRWMVVIGPYLLLLLPVGPLLLPYATIADDPVVNEYYYYNNNNNKVCVVCLSSSSSSSSTCGIPNDGNKKG